MDEPGERHMPPDLADEDADEFAGGGYVQSQLQHAQTFRAQKAAAFADQGQSNAEAALAEAQAKQANQQAGAEPALIEAIDTLNAAIDELKKAIDNLDRAATRR